MMKYIENIVFRRLFFLLFMVLSSAPFQAKSGPIEDLRVSLLWLRGAILTEIQGEASSLLHDFQTNSAVAAPCDASCPTLQCVAPSVHTRNCLVAACGGDAELLYCCCCCTCQESFLLMGCCPLVDSLGYLGQVLSLLCEAGISVGARVVNACSLLSRCPIGASNPMPPVLNNAEILQKLTELIELCDAIITRSAAISSIDAPPAYQANNFSGGNGDAGGAGPSPGAFLGALFFTGAAASQ